MKAILRLLLLPLFAQVGSAQTAPAITGQPQTVWLAPGGTATFSATASGATTYQWHHYSPTTGQFAISGATGSQLVLSNAQVTADSSGYYVLLASNSAGGVWSNYAYTLFITQQPTSTTVAAGGTAQFVVDVTEPRFAPGQTLQWRKNGVAIAGATSRTLTVSGVTTADNGAVFDVLFSRDDGSAVATGTSAPATLTVVGATAPAITAQPRTVWLAPGGTATFLATASGATTYQWHHYSPTTGQFAISGATGSQLVLSNAQVTADSSGYYVLLASNSAGGVWSNYAYTLFITQQPTSTTVAAGGTAQFVVDVTEPRFAPGQTLQWRKNGVAIAGATSRTLTVSGVTTADNGAVFDVLFSRDDGSAVATGTSAPATLTVRTAPTITTPPSVLPTPVGNPVSICVTASGTAPLSYQWRKGGVGIAGATSACFAITAAQTGDAGSYDCVVSNAAGSVTSPVAVLSVGSPPVITTQPVSQSAPLTSAVGFTVAATGTGPLSYQWRKNGVNFTGAVTASHVMNNLQSSDAASYDVVVSNAFGTVISSVATLTVTPAVWFNVHPVSQTVYAGAGVTFSSVAAGYNSSVSYQWRKDAVAIAGATASSLSLGSLQPSSAGIYDVVASSYAGSVTSNPAVLTISAVGPTITTQPQGAALAVGGGTTLSVSAVGALPMSFQWRRNGLDLAGSTGSSLAFSNTQTYQAGDYSVLVSNAYGSALSAVARINVIPRVVSYSARVVVEPDGAAAAFLVEGSLPKKVLLRAVGPGLAPFGIAGLPDPRLELFDRGGNLVAVNDDWASSADFASVVATGSAVGAFALAVGSKDAAMLLTLAPGAYTARAVPASGPGGVAYLELFDADLATGPMSTVPYVAVRGRLSPGGGVVVGGLGSNGRGQRGYLLRAVGPALGIAGALANPSMLVVRDGLLVGQNDDWDANATDAAATVSATTRVAAFALPAGGRDAALSLSGNLHAGACTVQVGSGDTVGGLMLLELHDLDSARPASFAPFVASPPVHASVVAGSPAALRVLAHGSTPLSYQWRKDGVPISGATAATFALAAADAAAGGSYSVVVANAFGSATSLPAVLTVTGDSASAGATHALVGVPGYSPGSNVTITNTLTFSGAATGLGWSATLPSGWTLVSQAGAVGEVRPAVGDGGTLEWAWTLMPASPVTFSYTVATPAGASGPQQISAGAIIRLNGELARPAASPGPLVIPQILTHSADTDANGRISLLELTRVIELYNTRNGTTRTGAYAVASSVTEDGFAIDAGRSASTVVTLSRYHSGDSNRDGKFSLLELTRLIELYNYRSGGTRTGQYHAQAGTEDGFAPGP